ncbi:MAG: pyruvate/2-oxoglutarate dehydrogenase complex, dihydrolipoamide acyltransferase component [Microbacterium sp.]|jgi:pyruvate dehydrogenase E2 component (dihydrolipoamide acetyltransferase)|uniref:dihydrolipoamide acetyltransferase family protein n=1 Tax=Microbacterium sp. TaxID=51671 RepID=UPI00262E3DA9|nr:dihydrolipoamide acetyltransferase family protein [Microbacterium sp.]MDF2561461.1 pyruvate/2-oxoglutarate dehydrogenase complex, dihydrolipoamide acyltransferase component [Microbacterium sp.]
MIDILMPRLSDTMTEGAIATWHKKPGDAVAPGDLLLEIETDKALMEQEAYDAGVLTEILIPEGENVAIGTPIARLDDGSGTTPARVVTSASDQVRPAASVPAQTITRQDPAPAETTRTAATPLVRRIARERGIDLAEVPGTGPGGRIVRADLDDLIEGTSPRSAAAPEPASPARSGTVDGDLVPFDATRRTIAARMSEAGAIPTFTVTSSAEMGELLALRARLNETTSAAEHRVSINDLVVKAAASALRAHPEINASYSPQGGGATLVHRDVNIGIAMAAPAGLVVPVLRAPDSATITTIARSTRAFAARAAERRLDGADMAGGTFTVSNLGMYGVEHFTAIINPPQGAILAVGAIRDELALADESVGVRRRISFTLTADHRIIDGAVGAQFLRTLVHLIEEPLQLLM